MVKRAVSGKGHNLNETPVYGYHGKGHIPMKGPRRAKKMHGRGGGIRKGAKRR